MFTRPIWRSGIYEFNEEKTMQPVTALLQRLAEGDRAAYDDLLPAVYAELKVRAHGQLKRERAGHTINTTALVHEAFIKLVDQNDAHWKNRAHFLAVASQAMRRILIDYARARVAEKRGGGQPLVTFNDELHQGDHNAEQLIELDLALQELEKLDKTQSQIVDYHFFGGLTYDEIAEVLGVSVATVGREWRLARAWLSKALNEN
jgi:RNA polymerase sigma factor (TIGR02999 family)